MKELFAALPRTARHNLVLLDTCFLIDVFVHHKEVELTEFCMHHDVAVTSFNVEELVFVLPKLKDKHIKDHMRSYFKEHKGLMVVQVPVSPGDHDSEAAYVAAIDPFLAQDIPDPSDAVLVATAIKMHSIVLTKDKHDLFTVVLERYLQRWGLKVVKSFKDV